MAKKKVSMENIAEKFGISKVSVSKAINGQPGVSDALREKILAMAEEIGYSKKSLSGRLLTGKFAYIVPKRYFFENENFYTEIYYYLNLLCQKANFELSVFVISRREEDECLPPEVYSFAKKYLGIFFAGQMKSEYYDLFYHMNAPIVAIDAYYPNRDADFVVSDNFRAGYRVASYLYEMGHRDIGFVGYKQGDGENIERFLGYHNMLVQKGLKMRDDWILADRNEYTNKYSIDFSLPAELPTAFICHCDATAYFLIQKLNGNGIRVPEDVSVIGFDNTEISTISNPKISTIDIDRKVFAQTAYDVMLQRLKEKEKQPRLTHYIGNKLLERDSVKKI